MSYSFRLDSKKPWNTAPNDDWEVVVYDDAKFRKGAKLGTRTIDGSSCTVVMTADGVYARTRASGA